MYRTEFLAALALRLEDLPAEERDEAVKYYSEYLDEAGPDGEDTAIEELGGAEKAANIIRANLGYGPLRPQPKASSPTPVPELTLDGPLWTKADEVLSEAKATLEHTDATAQTAPEDFLTRQQREEAQAEGPQAESTQASASQPAHSDAATALAAAAGTVIDTAAAALSGAAGAVADVICGNREGTCVQPDGSAYGGAATAPGAGAPYTAPLYHAPQGTQGGTSGAAQGYDTRNTRLLWILLIIFSFPVWIGLLGGLFGLVMGILGALVGVFFAGAGLIISAVVKGIAAVPLFFASPAAGLATLGLCVLSAGVGALMCGLVLLALWKGLPWFWGLMCKFYGWLRGKVVGCRG